MDIVSKLLEDVPIPRVIKAKQIFPRIRVEDISKELYNQLTDKGLLSNVKPGQRIAITAGSRGIANLPLMMKELVTYIRAQRAYPFIIPAMGSHGGATADGQVNLLNKMGISEEYIKAPIKSSMEVDLIGHTEDGVPVFVDRYANEADGIVVINRIKLHTSFRGEYESGLMKMMAIGLGKQKGAETCHRLGFGTMAKNVPAIGRVVIEKKNIVFAIGIIENAYDETAKIIALSKDEIESKEPSLLKEAKALMGKINFDQLDVLIIEEIGKDISGTGMDTNVIGRYHTPYAYGGPKITRIAVLNLTHRTQGNANGIGIVDFTTEKVFKSMEWGQTYPNAITSTVPDSVKIPMVLKNDREAIQAAIKTSNIENKENVRLAIIKNTRDLDEIFISESLIEEAKLKEDIELIGEIKDISFDFKGNITLFSKAQEV
ncbi:nickel pincer cofactor-dependent isomerase, group 22 [Tepidimicrobium xylanilyticum]|uniref:LarA-like N-terminal domain-containing protein n=1 Tax=Tepidimicrobium xylanilyticum TaxID=1123352 RepID=A0A1H2QN17_9FIRM|nr:lactate racemase domain-containing protein [Tepidimicrobium xylanilyticum]GMG95625.1 hypothetical protein EN5CB1_04510 [Tepidimicrobium xylanilyticum]SDW08300.1 protein of unknown function [Tepidimicrobium xylanilyticum]